jgi:hypothetical protein
MKKEEIIHSLEACFKIRPTGFFYSVVNLSANDFCFDKFREEGIDVFNVDDINFKKTKELVQDTLLGKIISENKETGEQIIQKRKSFIVCYPDGTTKLSDEGYKIPIHDLATSTFANRSTWLEFNK